MYHRVEKELVFAGTWFLQKGISGKVPLRKKEYGKEFLFFCRNLEVIPQDSQNWKAKKRNAKRNAQPSWHSDQKTTQIRKKGFTKLGGKMLSKYSPKISNFPSYLHSR
jgi:hypothetical protein